MNLFTRFVNRILEPSKVVGINRNLAEVLLVEQLKDAQRLRELQTKAINLAHYEQKLQKPWSSNMPPLSSSANRASISAHTNNDR